ncbi:unnamed protein product [marine sediment metagenome]|uniref:Uncharacterized protein n=1 Tax=marine sediment metagenome TaxID=412755 RepID=X0UPI1_9ZZZZ
MPDPRIWPVPSANDGGVIVGAASAIVLAANPNRVDAEFTNYSDPSEAICLARGNAAVMGQGIILTVYGGTYRIGTNNLFLGDIYAICESGDAILAISEGVKP